MSLPNILLQLFHMTFIHCAVFGKESSTKSSGQSRHPIEMCCKWETSSRPPPSPRGPQVQFRVDRKITAAFAVRKRMMKVKADGQTTIRSRRRNRISVFFRTKNCSPTLSVTLCWTGARPARPSRNWTSWSWNFECEEAVVRHTRIEGIKAVLANTVAPRARGR